MISLIVGKKGTGKTKALVERVNEAVETSKGNVVCVEKDRNLTFNLTHRARLVVAEEYGIEGYDEFYGFLTGLLAGNYDITHLFVDGIFKIAGRDVAAFEKMLSKLVRHLSQSEVNITFTVSCDSCELTEETLKYAVDFQ